MKHKLLSFLLSGIIFLSVGTTAFASSNREAYDSMDNSILAEMSGTSIQEVEEAKSYYGTKFNAMFENYINNVRLPDNYGSTEPASVVFADAKTGIEYSYKPSARISQEHWNFMKETFKKGQILVTDDASTLSVDHGHAAIMVSTTHTVEHLGKTTSKTSGYYDVGWWQGFNTMKSYNYSSTDVMNKAANYANNNLQNWNYNAFSDRNSASTVNCATLVWKAYNSQGVNTVNSTSGGVYPVDFDKSTKISWVRSVGWNNVNW